MSQLFPSRWSDKYLLTVTGLTGPTVVNIEATDRAQQHSGPVKGGQYILLQSQEARAIADQVEVG